MVQVVQPETILRWHRAGFKAFWHWKWSCQLFGAAIPGAIGPIRPFAVTPQSASKLTAFIGGRESRL
jgi:hypothetical protein